MSSVIPGKQFPLDRKPQRFDINSRFLLHRQRTACVSIFAGLSSNLKLSDRCGSDILKVWLWARSLLKLFFNFYPCSFHTQCSYWQSWIWDFNNIFNITCTNHTSCSALVHEYPCSLLQVLGFRAAHWYFLVIYGLCICVI